ncbi:MAG: hypothetical protein KIG60_03890 [Caryophanon sp.]|nr:hypothetical protein [Caryophanon sp.]
MSFTKVVPSKEEYMTTLVKNLIHYRIIRMYEGKLITARKMADPDSLYFETEDGLCREWLNSIYDSYHFYEGFETIESCEQYIRSSHYPDEKYIIICFLNMYYAVVYENTQHQQIIGKDLAYYTKNNLFLVSERPPNNLMMKDRERLPVIPLIYYELAAFDANMQTFHLHKESNQFIECALEEHLEYVVLLGITFKDCWYLCDTPYAIAHNRQILNMYFNDGHGFTVFGKYANAIAINPFQRLLYMPKERVEHYQMDIDNHRAPHRALPYREVRRFHENMRTRPVTFTQNTL